MRKLLLHIFRVTLALGIILGILLFSGLLYLSDFGGHRQASPVVAGPSESDAEAPPPVDPQPVSLQWMQWVFGPPVEAPPPLPAASQ